MKKFFKKIFKKKFLTKKCQKTGSSLRVFHILHFCILFELNCKNAKNQKKMAFLSFFAFLKTCTALYTPCFCCKGRQSPWQKPANLYSTKCRIFMRQNPLSRVTVHDSCTTQRRTNFFQKKKIFYSSEILSSQKF